MAEGGEHVDTVFKKPEGRPLGAADVPHQAAIEQLHGAGLYVHLGIYQSSSRIKEEDIKEAMTMVTRHQEALQMRIIPEPEKGKLAYRFEVRDDPFDINFKSVVLENKLDWVRVVKDGVPETIDFKNGPLWSTTFCQIEEQTGNDDYPYQFIVIHKSHHAIADAVSVFDMLYRQFMPFLSGVVNKTGCEGIMPVVPLMKTNEELFLTKKQMKNPVPWYMKLAFSLFRWKNRKFGTSNLPKFCFEEDNFQPDESAEFPPFECIPFAFDKELTNDVIKSSKLNGVTVHCALLAINSLALSATAAKAGVKLPKSIRTAWPINLRRFLGWETPQPLGGVTGAGFTVTNVSSTVTKEEFWLLCRKIQASVKSQTGKEKIAKGVALGQYFVDMISEIPLLEGFREVFLQLVGSISNIGHCDGEQEPKMAEGEVKIKLVEHHFTLLFKQINIIVPFFHCVSTFGGSLLWNLTYNSFGASPHFMEEYIGNIQKVAVEFCKVNEN